MVTAIGCEGPHNIQDHYSNTALGVLRVIAGAMGQAGSNNILGGGSPLLRWARSTRPPSRARATPSAR